MTIAQVYTAGDRQAMCARIFDTIWLCGDQVLDRRVVKADDMDAALVAAWMDMLTIARADHKPCDTIRITDTANGQTITEDVPPFTPPSRRIGTALLIFIAGCIALPVGIWMARHGWARGSGMQGKAMIYSMMAFPMGWTIAIVVAAMAHERQEAIATWKKDYGGLRPARLPDNPRQARIVVARFSAWQVLSRLALGLGMVGAMLWFPLASRLASGQWQLWHPMLLACAAVLFPFILLAPRQLAFDRGAALWIQGGELVQCSRLALCLPIWGIAGIAVGKFKPPKSFPYTAILVTGKDGSTTPISPQAFREPPEEIVARLNRLLRLSPQTAAKAAA